MKIKSIKKVCQKEKVFDIQTRNDNFSLGNGCIVHNSKDISDSLASCIYNAYLNRDRSFTLLDGFVNPRSSDSRMELLSDEERIFQKSLDNGDGWKVVSSSDSLIL